MNLEKTNWKASEKDHPRYHQEHSWSMRISQNTNIKRSMEEVGSSSHRRIGGVQDFSGENS